VNNIKKQHGAVLLVAMIFLIVITILGVSAVNSSTIKTQVAGNSISTMLVYTGGESALAKSASDPDSKNLINALPVASLSVPAVYLPDEDTGNGILESEVEITFTGVGQKCPIGTNGMAISSIMKCKIWILDARSSLQATNAKANHIKAIATVH